MQHEHITKTITDQTKRMEDVEVAEEISKSTKWLGLVIVCVDFGWCCTFAVEFFVTGTLS